MEPDGMQPQVLSELADVTIRPLSIILERSWKLGKSFWSFTELVAFYDKRTSLVHEEKAVDVFCFVFDIVSLNTLTGKFIKYRLGKRTVTWAKN